MKFPDTSKDSGIPPGIQGKAGLCLPAQYPPQQSRSTCTSDCPFPEQVANMGRAIHCHLCSIHIPEAKANVLQAVTMLARDHTSELVAAFLDFSMPLDRCQPQLLSLSLHPLPEQEQNWAFLWELHISRRALGRLTYPT